MDKSPIDGVLWLGAGATLSRSRSGQHLRRCLHSTPSGDGHSGSTNRAAIAWQNGYCERLIGSIRRDCLDHVVVFGERHLRHLLRSYEHYYNQTRTHLSLNKDSPVTRSVETVGRILPLSILGGLHHQYVRI